MPQQLIYTSAPRGVVAGRSGHCTVARSAAMREAVMLQLEKWSYYQHLSLSGGQERPIHCCRVMDIRGARFHVVSRIQDAGLDFTGRTNFLAHHLVFTPEEIRQLPLPPMILCDWSGWVRAWAQEPQLLEHEDWSALGQLATKDSVPAKTWHQLTGDAVNGYGLLEARAGSTFQVNHLKAEQILSLFGESLELLDLRDPRRDFRATAWQYTFTTSMQEQDNPADFRWRCLHSDNPASNRFAGPDCRPLSEVRAARITSEETLFARSGRQPPRFVVQPQSIRVTEGGTAKLQAKAEGVPAPNYQWFTVDRAGNGQLIPHGTEAELVVPDAPLGVSRYVARASNSRGEATSEVVTLSVEQKLKVSRPGDGALRVTPKKPGTIDEDYEEKRDRQRERLEAQKAEKQYWQTQRRKRIAMVCGVIALLVFAGALFWKWSRPAPNRSAHNVASGTNSGAFSPKESPPTVGDKPDTTEPQPKSQGSETADDPHTGKRENSPQAETKNSLPEGWTTVAIGNVTNARAEFIAEKSRYDLYATTAGFVTTLDSILFAYKTNSGPEFHALVKIELQGVGGIMIRETLATNSPFLFIGAQPDKIIALRRDSQGLTYSSEAIALINRNRGVSLEFSSGSNHTISAFGFGTGSVRVFSNLAFTNNAKLVGLALCSGSLSNKASVQFSNVAP